MKTQGYTSAWDESVEEATAAAETLPSASQPVASYNQYARSQSMSSCSSQDSFYTLHDEPFEHGVETPRMEEEPSKLSQQPRLFQRSRASSLPISNALIPNYASTEALSETQPQDAPTQSPLVGTGVDSCSEMVPRAYTPTHIQHGPSRSTASTITGPPAVLAPSLEEDILSKTDVADEQFPDRQNDDSDPVAEIPSVAMVSLSTSGYSERTVMELSQTELEDLFSEAELLGLERKIAPRPRLRSKDLSKIFGRTPNHTYPPPMPSPPVPGFSRRTDHRFQDAASIVSVGDEPPRKSHIEDVRRKLAWRPTAASNEEKEADRRDLALLLGGGNPLAAKLFGDEEEQPSEELLGSHSKQVAPIHSGTSHRRPVWRPSEAPDYKPTIDHPDLHQYLTLDEDNEAETEALGGLAALHGNIKGERLTPLLESKASEAPVIPPRVASANRLSKQSSAAYETKACNAPAIKRNISARTSHASRPSSTATVTPFDAAASEVDFYSFSSISPAGYMQDTATQIKQEAASYKRTNSRSESGSDTASGKNKVMRLQAYHEPSQEHLSLDLTPNALLDRDDSRTTSLSTETASTISELASPGAESPLSEAEGTSDRGESRDGKLGTWNQVTSQSVEGRSDGAQLTASGSARHQHQPSASTMTSSIASSILLADSEDDVSIISAHDFSQPPAHITLQHPHTQPYYLPISDTTSLRSGIAAYPAEAGRFGMPSPPRSAGQRSSSPSQSLDCAAPPPIALVRNSANTSPSNMDKRRKSRPRPLSIIKQTLFRRSSQGSPLTSPLTPPLHTPYSPPLASPLAHSFYSVPGTPMFSPTGAYTVTTAYAGSRSSFESVSYKNATDALEELTRNSVSYEQAAPGQRPFTSKEAAAIYPTRRPRKAQNPLGLSVLAEFEMRESIARSTSSQENITGAYNDSRLPLSFESLALREQQQPRTDSTEQRLSSERDVDEWDSDAKRLSSVVEEN